MSKSMIVKLVLTFVAGGAVALAKGGLISLPPEAVEGLFTMLGTVLGGAFVNAKK